VHARNSRDLATVVSDLDRRVIKVFDACTGMVIALASNTPPPPCVLGSRSSRSTVQRPTGAKAGALPRHRSVCDGFEVGRAANTVLAAVRRAPRRDAGGKRPKGTRGSGHTACTSTPLAPRTHSGLRRSAPSTAPDLTALQTFAKPSGRGGPSCSPTSTNQRPAHSPEIIAQQWLRYWSACDRTADSASSGDSTTSRCQSSN